MLGGMRIEQDAEPVKPTPMPSPPPRNRRPIGRLLFLAGAAAFCVFMAGRYHCVTNTRVDGGFAVIRKVEWSLRDQLVNANDYRGVNLPNDLPAHRRAVLALVRAEILDPNEPAVQLSQ